jgi:hypothetical protein
MEGRASEPHGGGAVCTSRCCTCEYTAWDIGAVFARGGEEGAGVECPW